MTAAHGQAGLRAGVSMECRIVLAEAPDEADRAAILAPLVAHNDAQAGDGHYQLLALKLVDGAGATIGGLWGKSMYDWLFVELLAVPAALRGTGTGTALMRRAEAVAASRGCVGVWLDTFSFQAKPFYEKRGYVEFGVLPHYPRGHSRHFMRKMLSKPG